MDDLIAYPLKLWNTSLGKYLTYLLFTYDIYNTYQDDLNEKNLEKKYKLRFWNTLRILSSMYIMINDDNILGMILINTVITTYISTIQDTSTLSKIFIILNIVLIGILYR